MAYTTINKSTDYFNTKLYTGNGSPTSNSQTISGIGFQPDFVWTKNRDDTWSNTLINAVSGGTKYLYSDTTDAEATNSTMITAFNSDGYIVGEHGDINRNTERNVSWNWLGANGTAANTDGSISSTVSANTTSGFSIVSWTGTGSASTIGHGLNAVPKMYIVKNKSTGSTQWRVYHASLGATKFMCLDATQAVGTASSIFNNTEPTSSVFSVGTDDAANKSGDSLIAYCFAEKTGYSKFGSYTGNGNADGPFVYTGFKPAFIMVKRTDSSTGGSWIMYDTKRNPYNVSDIVLAANSASSEAGWGNVYDVDILSNGFKWRNDGGSGYVNVSGASYIYMAFAEAPLVGSNNVPTTAR